MEGADEPPRDLYKTKLIRRSGPCKGLEDVELATLEWVWRFTHHRLLETIGYVPRWSSRRRTTVVTLP